MLTPAATPWSEFMPMTDAGIQDAVDRLRGRGVDMEPGLTDPEVAADESAHGFRFPPDLRRLLQAALPVSAGFPDWRSAEPDRLRHFVLDPDFSFGMVGNPVERTLCVFGRRLLDAVLADTPPGLGAVLRCGGQTVDSPLVVAESEFQL